MTPFYEKAKNLWQTVQNAQILKGLQKYPEPFNPHSWTPEELLNHALEETVDLTHYLVGLKELLDAKDKEIQDWMALARHKENEVEALKQEVIQLKNRLPKKPHLEEHSFLFPKKSPFEEQDLLDSINPKDK
jgi:hypothetical protein